MPAYPTRGAMSNEVLGEYWWELVRSFCAPWDRVGGVCNHVCSLYGLYGGTTQPAA